MIRQIKKVVEKQIILELPDEYLGQEIEVLVFPISETVESKSSDKKVFSAIEIQTKDFQFDRNEANER